MRQALAQRATWPAKAVLSAISDTQVLTPITSPLEFKSGPPLLPGEIGAVV